MELKGERCFRCNNFDAYFTKGTKRFNRTKCGWCCAKRETVECYGSCEKFEIRSRRGHALRLIKPCLNDMLTELIEIRNLIEEELDENKNL